MTKGEGIRVWEDSKKNHVIYVILKHSLTQIRKFRGCLIMSYIKSSTDDITCLNSEITAFTNEIKRKEKEL